MIAAPLALTIRRTIKHPGAALLSVIESGKSRRFWDEKESTKRGALRYID